MQTRLLAKNPLDRKSREFRLTKAEVTVGSEKGNTLRLQHKTVSRRHAVIRPYGSTHEVRDLRSTNGTFVNEQRIEGPTVLKDGDHIRFGAAGFVYVHPQAGPAHGKRRPIRLVPLIEFLLIMFVAGFGLAEYFLNRQSPGKPAGMAHDESTTPITVLNARSEPSAQIAAATVPIPAASARVVTAPPGSSSSGTDWVKQVNYYRSMAALRPVANDPTLSGGCLNHARYLVENYGAVVKGGGILGSAVHDEQTDKKDYTEEGANCASNGDVAWGCGPFTESDSVDHWVEGPFHRLGILNPALERAGFGEFQVDGCWFSAIRLLGHPDYMRYERPIYFPPDGSTIGLRWRGGEWPNPLDGCPGYSEPVGLPITVQLGYGFYPHLTSHSLTEGGLAVDHCAYDAQGYSSTDRYMQEYARTVLHSHAAIVLIARHPLAAGKTYTVSVTADGKNYQWSFTTAVSAS